MSLAQHYTTLPLGTTQPPTLSNSSSTSNSRSNTNSTPMFASIPAALHSFSKGNFLIVLDNLDRENEGDLIIAAEDCTPAKLAFMIRYTSGVICAPMSGERCDAFGLPAMWKENQDLYATAYTVSCDAVGTTTGISARDRSLTLNTLASNIPLSSSLTRPGHIFPLRAHPKGVLGRVGHTEAAVDLCMLTGKVGCAAISEIVSEWSGCCVGEVQEVQEGEEGEEEGEEGEEGERVQGEGARGGIEGAQGEEEMLECCGENVGNGGMARRDELHLLSKRWNIPMITIDDLRKYRLSLPQHDNPESTTE